MVPASRGVRVCAVHWRRLLTRVTELQIAQCGWDKRPVSTPVGDRALGAAICRRVFIVFREGMALKLVFGKTAQSDHARTGSSARNIVNIIASCAR